MQILLVVLFIAFVVLGVPISFALGFVSFAGIAALPIIPNSVVFTKMFNGLNSFTLLAVPLFILAANLMNEGAISDRLIDVCSASAYHFLSGSVCYKDVSVLWLFLPAELYQRSLLHCASYLYGWHPLNPPACSGLLS